MSTWDKLAWIGIATFLGLITCEWLVKQVRFRRALRQMGRDDLYRNAVRFTAKHPHMPEAYFACFEFGRTAGVPAATIAENIREAVRLQSKPYAPVFCNDLSARPSAGHLQ